MAADAVAIIISSESMTSVHVRNELFKAYESGKTLVPILRGLSHAEFSNSRADLHQALVTNVAIPIPHNGLDAILDRIIAGLRAIVENEFDFSRADSATPPEKASTSPPISTTDPWEQLKSRLPGLTGDIA